MSAQVYEEMKKELEVMTKPKDPNVLVVHGVSAPTIYAMRSALRERR